MVQMARPGKQQTWKRAPIDRETRWQSNQRSHSNPMSLATADPWLATSTIFNEYINAYLGKPLDLFVSDVPLHRRWMTVGARCIPPKDPRRFRIASGVP